MEHSCPQILEYKVHVGDRTEKKKRRNPPWCSQERDFGKACPQGLSEQVTYTDLKEQSVCKESTQELQTKKPHKNKQEGEGLVNSRNRNKTSMARPESGMGWRGRRARCLRPAEMGLEKGWLQPNRGKTKPRMLQSEPGRKEFKKKNIFHVVDTYLITAKKQGSSLWRIV